ncbi:hypothetical protein VP01_2453g3 [Puccinia sorghi]|uniref:Uncharacterized protein n=1 Tax=Puccinia sorghi TaxID=27349 RepID=A0A0L6V673_9BASI|nr:hypothetical protein VP01_2453g3 [Puccinia sorghi]
MTLKSPSTDTVHSLTSDHTPLTEAPNLPPTPLTAPTNPPPSIPVNPEPTSTPPFLASHIAAFGNHVPFFIPPNSPTNHFLLPKYDLQTCPCTSMPLQRCLNHEQVLQLHFDLILNHQWIDIEHRQLFSITNIQKFVNLVSSNFSTYCNSFPTGFRKRQAQVRFSRSIQDHLNLIIILSEI